MKGCVRRAEIGTVAFRTTIMRSNDSAWSGSDRERHVDGTRRICTGHDISVRIDDLSAQQCHILPVEQQSLACAFRDIGRVDIETDGCWRAWRNDGMQAND